jgi:lipopolysaccharide heptosyltransferase III
MSGRRTAPSQTFAFLAGNHDELHWLNRLDVNVPTKMNRILVIRGGAIGDFILTLPALKALRDAHPHAHIEIIGHKPVAALAEGRFYAQAVRSIEDTRLSSFFVRNAQLSADLADYFASFDLVISYLHDPDETFEENLGRCAVRTLVRGPSKISNGAHAARQLASPIEQLGVKVVDLAAKVFPSAEDRQLARDFVRDLPSPIVTIHPGSGSERKNWPIEKWIGLFSTSGSLRPSARGYQCLGGRSLILFGEADEARRALLEREWKNQDVRFARNLPLTQLAAILEQSIFLGHDSGISHLAAAAGANCILLFGPTDPEIWAPLNEKVRVIRAPNGEMSSIGLGTVRETLQW